MSLNKSEIQKNLESFFSKKLEIVFDGSDLHYDTNLIEQGLLDSLSFLVLVNYMDKTFKVKVYLDDISVSSIDSFNKIVEFIEKHSA